MLDGLIRITNSVLAAGHDSALAACVQLFDVLAADAQESERHRDCGLPPLLQPLLIQVMERWSDEQDREFARQGQCLEDARSAAARLLGELEARTRQTQVQMPVRLLEEMFAP